MSAAQALQGEDLLEDALSRCYYAVPHSARALLLAEGINPKSHEATRRLFGLHLIRSGKMTREYARILREEQDDRLLADYDVAFVPDAERAEKRITDAKAFLDEAERLLGGS